MTRRRRLVTLAALVAAALAGTAAAIATGVAGDDEQVTGAAAMRAGEAAVDAVGGGVVLEVERADGDGVGAYEVEVRRRDGTTVEVHLDERFVLVGSEPDDERGDGAEEADGGDDD